MRDSEVKTLEHRGSIVMPQKQKLTVEEKVKIVRDCLKNRISTSKAARRGGVGFITVKRWISIYNRTFHRKLKKVGITQSMYRKGIGNMIVN